MTCVNHVCGILKMQLLRCTQSEGSGPAGGGSQVFPKGSNYIVYVCTFYDGAWPIGLVPAPA